MGVKVDDVKGAGGLHPQDGGIGDRVVAAQDHRHGPLLRQQTHRLGQILKCGLQVPGDIVHVAAVHNGPAVGIQIHLVPLRVVGAAGLVGEPCGGSPDAPGPQPGPCAALDGQVKGSSQHRNICPCVVQVQTNRTFGKAGNSRGSQVDRSSNAEVIHSAHLVWTLFQNWF